MRKNILNKSESIQVLKRSLAEALDIRQQISCAHWNFNQHNFYAFHQSADDVLNEISHTIKNLAQRIAQLGEPVEENWKTIANQSRILDCPSNLKSEREQYEHYVTAMAIHSAELRKGIQQIKKNGDLISASILMKAAQRSEKFLCLFEANIQISNKFEKVEPGREQHGKSL